MEGLNDLDLISLVPTMSENIILLLKDVDSVGNIRNTLSENFLGEMVV